MSDKQFLINFQKFLIDLNINRSSEETLESINRNDDYFIKHLKQIRFHQASEKAKFKIKLQSRVSEFMQTIIQSHGNIEAYIQTLVSKPEHQKVVALFRKFESLDKEDSDQMLIESELLELLDSLQESND